MPPSTTRVCPVTNADASLARKTAAEANVYLNERGIMPRQFAVEDFDNKLRFTVGDDAGMEKTIEVMRAFMQT